MLDLIAESINQFEEIKWIFGFVSVFREKLICIIRELHINRIFKLFKSQSIHKNLVFKAKILTLF